MINMLRNRILIIMMLLICSLTGLAQDTGESFGIRIFCYPMDPRMHPDDTRRVVKPPGSATFGNTIQFMALRSLDGDYKKLLDQYTIKYGLGNIIWPSYPVLFRNDLPDVVAELKKRNLYLFDIWGFVPGSGPGGYWQQFVVPDGVLDLFDKELGDHWLGMDNGEQDGRYVGGYANQMYPRGGDRESQYLNFQNHFQGLTDRLGNKMATLVSLNFGHYFLKEEVYTMIGAETAQGLPNTQVYYSFIRGAGKQYGVPWFGNASVWNRWGWKNYSGVSDYNGGDTKGTSLSLLKRLIYSHIMYNCSAVGFESSFLDKMEKLSPVGKIQQSARQWVEKYGNPGILYTPVAVMLDFFAGWSFPRHLYTDDIYRVWGNLPYDEGDYLTDDIIDLIYPGYQDASFFHDETGFIVQTPYGDAADCILSDCPVWLMEQYPLVIIGGRLKGGHEIKDKLEKYVKDGGRLVITAGNIKNLPGGICGVTTGSKSTRFDENAEVLAGDRVFREKTSFSACELVLPGNSRVIASCDNVSLAARINYGKGSVTVLASPFGIGSEPGQTENPGIDTRMKSPYPLLSHAQYILGDILNNVPIFDPVEGLSMITCRRAKGDYTLAICNNTWTGKSFRISSRAGKILKIKELPVDCSERNATGFLPETVKGSAGVNTGSSIAGGDIRIFSVKLAEDNTEEIPFIRPVSDPVNRGLSLPGITSLKREILLRPTFFQHFDRVLVDWKYLDTREKEVLAGESIWIRNQGLKVMVDLTSGINLFPDLRLVNNDSLEYGRSLERIISLIEKMSVMGAQDLVLATHRTIENNFTDIEFDVSLQKTLKMLCRQAAEYQINIHLRPLPGRYTSTVDKAKVIQAIVDEPNFLIAPSLALLISDSLKTGNILQTMEDLKYSVLFIDAPEKDISGKIWNINLPLYKYDNDPDVLNIITKAEDKILILDGIYDGQDEEYLDMKNLENLTVR